MNIALAHFRVKNIDGVSLEMEKFRIVLEQLGHSVFFIAGNEADKKTFCIEELYYKNERNNTIVLNAYKNFSDFDNEKEFEKEIYRYAEKIEFKLIELIEKLKIELIIPNNIFSLGWNLSAALAFYNASLKTNTKVLCHHHDFWWERVKYSNPTKYFINDLLEKYFPPKHDLFKHIVINKIAKDALIKRKQIDSSVVPNVFDFEAKDWIEDDYNKDFRKKIGIEANDLIVLQPTRIVERKAVELAIDVVSEMNNQKEKLIGKKLYNGQIFTSESSIYLVFANLNESVNYYSRLLNYAREKNVKLHDINNHIKYDRKVEGKEKYYNLWDAYVISDMVTYPSMKEGWGNQFLEVIFSKNPVIIYEYPVFKTDIKQFNFNVISLGDKFSRKENGLIEVDKTLIDDCVKHTLKYLTDNAFRTKMVNENFELGKKHLSLESLGKKISKIV